MPRRRSELSIEAMMCLRDRPRSFSPSDIAMYTLVATTTSSRRNSLPSSRPVTTSLAPPAYASAVSKKITPPSAAARTRGSAASSSSTHCLLLLSPKLIMPRQIRDTRRPVEPRLTYSMNTLSLMIRRQPPT
jgi:hypothetical protein